MYNTPRGPVAAVVIGTALARTGFSSLLWAEIAVVRVFVGLVLLRASSVRRARR